VAKAEFKHFRRYEVLTSKCHHNLTVVVRKKNDIYDEKYGNGIGASKECPSLSQPGKTYKPQDILRNNTKLSIATFCKNRRPFYGQSVLLHNRNRLLL
jgi:hypothetical protein